MTIGVAALLFAAGIIGGIMNAVAGGASLVTFPAMMMSGLPPIIANASNALAVMPGNIIAVIADRKQIPWHGHRISLLLAIAIIGGGAGAFLLLVTPERFFTQLVPALIGGATLLFAATKKIQFWILRLTKRDQQSESSEAVPSNRLHVGFVSSALGPAATYGGYFGAGLGIMLMTIFVLGGLSDLRRANALKNLVASACASACVIAFIFQGAISWPQTLLMLSGAIGGGFIGSRLVRWLPIGTFRWIIVAIGALLSAIYAWRYWL